MANPPGKALEAAAIACSVSSTLKSGTVVNTSDVAVYHKSFPIMGFVKVESIDVQSSSLPLNCCTYACLEIKCSVDNSFLVNTRSLALQLKLAS